MKFLATEHQSIKSAILDSGKEFESFSFVKRRGKIHIQYQDKEPPFVYFRKKETYLDERNQWVKTTHYLIYQSPPTKTVESWQEVMVEFNKWLSAC